MRLEEAVWPCRILVVGCCIAAVLGEADIYRGTPNDTIVKIGLLQSLQCRASIVSVALDQECLSLRGVSCTIVDWTML